MRPACQRNRPVKSGLGCTPLPRLGGYDAILAGNARPGGRNVPSRLQPLKALALNETGRLLSSGFPMQDRGELGCQQS